MTLQEVKSFIHQHLADPKLSSCIIAKALNISKSYLYLLFQRENTTVRCEPTAISVSGLRAEKFKFTELLVFELGYNINIKRDIVAAMAHDQL